MDDRCREPGLVTGRRTAHPVRLLLHGFGDEPSTWEQVTRRLDGDTSAEVPDLYDPSLRQQGGLRGLAAVSRGLKVHYAGRDVHTIVGHSLGGVLATMLAQALGAHVVINIEGNLTPEDCTLSAQYAGAAKPLTLFRKWRADGLPSRYVDSIAHRPVEQLRDDAHDLIADSTGPAFSRWSGLRQLTTYIHGKGTPESTRHTLRNAGLSVAYVATASHWIQETEPEAVVSTITELETGCRSCDGNGHHVRA